MHFLSVFWITQAGAWTSAATRISGNCVKSSMLWYLSGFSASLQQLTLQELPELEAVSAVQFFMMQSVYKKFDNIKAD